MKVRIVWRVLLIIVLVLAALALAVDSAAAQEPPARIIFMHHSTGGGLIWHGGVREAFTDLGYEFWDHGYNDEGLTDATGNATGINWEVPDDNTDPDGWFNIFAQPVTDPPSNTLSHMLEYDVIIFKSCFPTSNIESDEQLEAYQSYYLAIRDVIDQHPDKLFIAFTPPPLIPNDTAPEAAARARVWSDYLASPQFLDGHPNLVVFNFFDLLADEDNLLRAEYRTSESDSHPNELANQALGPVFVEFVDQAIQSFAPGETPAPVEQIEPTESIEPADLEPAGEGIPAFDFEEGVRGEDWWDYTNEGTVAFVCDVIEPGSDSQYALQMAYDLNGGGSAGCGINFTTGEDWATLTGIAFDWRAEPSGLYLHMGLITGSAASDDQAPFEIELIAPSSEWESALITWDQLIKADWMGGGGPETFDPAQIVYLAFGVGHWEQPQAGTIWIDNIHFVQDE